MTHHFESVFFLSFCGSPSKDLYKTQFLHWSRKLIGWFWSFASLPLEPPNRLTPEVPAAGNGTNVPTVQDDVQWHLPRIDGTKSSTEPKKDLKEAIRELLQWPEDHRVLLKRRMQIRDWCWKFCVCNIHRFSGTLIIPVCLRYSYDSYVTCLPCHRRSQITLEDQDVLGVEDQEVLLECKEQHVVFLYIFL